MISRRSRSILCLSIFAAVLAWNASAAAVTEKTSVGKLTVPEIEEQLQV